MSDIFLPPIFTKVTRSTVVVPAPEDATPMLDPFTGRTVVPARVEMDLRWNYGTQRGDKAFAGVWVFGPRLLKSGTHGRTISVFGWQRAVVEGPHGVQRRPDWLTDLIATHLPTVLDLEAGR